MSGLPIISYNNVSSKSDKEQRTNQLSSSRGSLLSKSNQNTFVHKLRVLISDPKHANLIFWNLDGRSFMVTNIEEFSKTVIPLHFKHNNFASFIRQLNMYGFHKLNRSPRGLRADAAVQTWEFSHPKFLRDFPELMGEIRRTTSEPDINFKQSSTGLESSNILTLMQSQQSEILSQVQNLTSELSKVKRELNDSKRMLSFQQKVIKKLALSQPSVFNGSLSPALSDHGQFNQNDNHTNPSNQPTIFITPPDAQGQNNSQTGFLPGSQNDLVNSPHMETAFQSFATDEGSNNYFTNSNQIYNENHEIPFSVCNLVGNSLNDVGNLNMVSNVNNMFNNAGNLSENNGKQIQMAVRAQSVENSLSANMIHNMGNNMNYLNNNLSPTAESVGSPFNNSPNNFQSHLQLQPGGRPTLTINTMNLRPPVYLSPRPNGGNCSDASGSDEDFARVSPRSPVSPFHLQQVSYQTQLNASPIDPNNLSPNIFKPSPS